MPPKNQGSSFALETRLKRNYLLLPPCSPPPPSTSSYQDIQISGLLSKIIHCSSESKSTVNSCLSCTMYKRSIALLFPCTCFHTEKCSARKGYISPPFHTCKPTGFSRSFLSQPKQQSQHVPRHAEQAQCSPERQYLCNSQGTKDLSSSFVTAGLEGDISCFPWVGNTTSSFLRPVLIQHIQISLQWVGLLGLCISRVVNIFLYSLPNFLLE